MTLEQTTDIVIPLRRAKLLLARLATATLVALSIGCAVPMGDVRDVRILEQDARAYLDPTTAGTPLIEAAVLRGLNDVYNETYFSPWRAGELRYTREDIERKFEKYRRNGGFGENRRPRSEAWLAALYANAAIDSFPNTDTPAITTTNTDLRLLPTEKPLFLDFELPGEGYPFDYLQNSHIPVNTPVRITHTSRDKDWVFVDSPIAMGWIRSGHLAVVDDALMQRWEAGVGIVAIRDGVPVYDRRGRFLYRVPMGARFPGLGVGEDGTHRILAAVRDQEGRAATRTVSVSGDDFSKIPLTPTPDAIAGLINRMVGQTYGWGGMYGNRDCSATLKDLFAPFGIWLPRNSKRQAHDIGRQIDLRELSRSQKRKAIIEEGKPFATLIWRPGHIMLYLGSHAGEPIVFHNVWGVLTRGWLGEEGRKIIGEAVITTLSPGTELAGVHAKADLLSRAETMTILFAEK